MTKQTFPHVSQALLTALKEAFPDRAPELTDTDREIWVNVGAAQVVRFLAAKAEDQQQNPLGDDD